MGKSRVFALTLALCGYAAGAQTISILNSTFEADPSVGPGWSLSGGVGEWLSGDSVTDRSIAVTGTGDDTNYWRTDVLSLEPTTLYQVRFRARALSAAGGGTAISGPVFCNRDLGVPPQEGQEYATVFLAPANLTTELAWLRFGQWHMTGPVAFDDISLAAAQAVHTVRNGITLGTGESITDNTYAFNGPNAGEFGNYARPLVSHTCTFNTNRWAFGPASEIVHKHAIDSRKQLHASVELNVSTHDKGALLVEVRSDATDWLSAGELNAVGSQRFDLPSTLFPADAISVRLRTTDGSGAAFQVDGYTYTAQLDGDPVTIHGETRFVAVPSTDPRFEVTCTSLGDARPGGKNTVVARIDNRTQSELSLAATLTLAGPDGTSEAFASELNVSTDSSVVEVPYEVAESGEYAMEFAIGGPEAFRAKASFHVSKLFDATYGERLPQSNGTAGLWWASSGWKVSQDRPLPDKTGEAIIIRAACNEAEAAQLVVRPTHGLRGFTAKGGELRGPDGAGLPPDVIDVLRVRYVDITRPTDSTGVAAPWPDPLPPFVAPIDLKAGENQPLWVRVNVPPDAAPGLYEGSVLLEAEGYSAEVPLHIEVYGFALPDRSTCTTAFGFSPGNVFRYHNISEPEQQRQVLDMYWRNFLQHRIAPYDPAPLDHFVVTWPGVEDWKQGKTDNLEQAFMPAIDWAAWDAAMTRTIDDYGFNSFRLSIAGMGGGTFHSRTEPSLLGYAEDTPEYRTAFANYCRSVQEHLREKGWLDEAYVYWFDEPDPKDYEFVMNGFRKIHEAAPDINRMLTEQVEPALIGGPNIWCPISDAFDMEDAELRRAEGEKFWWYVCTGPKAPYCTLFIDHPATELRVWLWQTWQRKIDGILIWQSNYWTSSAAYPDVPQNPYTDPMGWTSGYSTPAGTKRPWGNGDGRFIYPPEAAADGQQQEPVVAGPVDSIRWEMLRDGVEDYEYLAILRDLIETANKAGVDDAVLNEYRALLEVPVEITASMTEFTIDPAPIEARRDDVARAIMRLRDESG
jgi:hypothetical protein